MPRTRRGAGPTPERVKDTRLVGPYHPAGTADNRGRAGRLVFAVSEPPAPHGMMRRGRWLHVIVTATTTDPLTAADRCDRCGAQAYVRVVMPSGQLLFCAHHAREHAPKFTALATHVQDETDRLLAEYGAGAGAAR